MKLALNLVVILASGCASQTPLVTQDFAGTGKQYTSLLKKVNSMALDHSLEFTADLLPGLPRENTTLQQFTEMMKERAVLLASTASYLDTQAIYFAELSSLAKGDNSSGNSRALKKLVETLNKTPELPGVSRVAKEAAVGLAEHVSRWRHAERVREVLTRDADSVGQALLINQMALEQQIQWINQREELARQVEYREKIQEPFTEEKKLGDTWKKAWVNHIKRPAEIELLEQARLASIGMQQAWVDVLRGEGSFEAMQSTLNQINLNIQAASQYESK